MSSYYDTMQVCIKWGHLITDNYDGSPLHRQEFCHKCGSKTVTTCQFCNTKIKGDLHVDGLLFIGGHYPDVPLNCHKCGNPYPWRKKLLAISYFKLLISPVKYVFDSVIGLFKK